MGNKGNSAPPSGCIKSIPWPRQRGTIRYMCAAKISRLEQRLASPSPTFTTAQPRQALLSARDLPFPGTETEIIHRIAAIAATESDDGVVFDPATLKAPQLRHSLVDASASSRSSPSGGSTTGSCGSARNPSPNTRPFNHRIARTPHAGPPAGAVGRSPALQIGSHSPW